MTLEEQKAVRPAYEQLAAMYLSGETKDVMDELVQYLKTIKLTPRWYATNAYNVKYKGRMIFRFTIGANNGVSLFFTVADKADLDGVLAALPEEIQSYYFKSFRACTECNPAHGGGRKVSLLGKTYGCCAEPEMRINNPVRDDLGYIIGFIPIRRENIRQHTK